MRGWRRQAGAALLCLLWLTTWAATAAAAQRATAAVAPPLRDYAVDAWSSRNGLPHNSLRDIAQTPDGYLWFATWEGVVRYNGTDFTVIDRGSRPGLRDNGIGALYVDPEGTLWLTDSRGNLGRHGDDGGWRYWERSGEWPQALIHDMEMDSRGSLWLLFEGHGLGRVDPDGSFHYLAPPPELPVAASFPRMAIDAQDRIWVGTLDGLVVREPDGRWRRAPAALDLPKGLVWPYRAPDGAIWVTASQRVYRIEDGAVVQQHALPGVGTFTAMLQDRNGGLWLGTENHGLLRIGPYGLERMAPGEVLPNGRVASLLEDAEGSIWIGANGGLFRLRETLFNGYTRRDGLRGDYVRALIEDRQGVLWVGGGGGLDRMGTDGRFHPAPVRGATGEALSVLSLAEDRSGDLWVGTFVDGVFRLRDGRRVAHYGPAQGMVSGHVRAISVARDGTVWVGSRTGLLRVEGAVMRAPPPVPGLPRGLITALASVGDTLWIGSVEGAHLLRDGQVEHLDLEALGGTRSVFGFQPIGDAVWISTDRGLFRWRDGQVDRVGLEQGVPVDAVFQLVPDRVGNAWISSNRGVLRSTMQALNAAADGRVLPIAMDRYTEIDGLVSSQGNGSSAPSTILRRDGSVWLATAGGVASVDPARMQRYLSRPAPPAVVEGVQVDGQAVAWQDGAVIPGGQRLTVSYAGLSYLFSERIRYRTRLLGLDSQWIDRGQQRSVEFLSLPPGNYTLQIAAAHPDGEWSREAAAWTFTVQPLWWQRASVRLAATLAALLGLIALYRYLIHRYRNRNLELERQVHERTRDLRQQTERLLVADRERNELLDQLRSQAEISERQAREDALTGLANRRHFDEVLARELAVARRGGRPLCLAMIDIDHFKRINDTWSHSTGDQVLREVGRVLAADCRSSDLLARLGGEEFALLMVDTRLEAAVAACERLRGRFRAHGDWAGVEGLQVTFSAGVVACSADDTPASLFRRVDEALYRAKREGRDRIRTD
ncbi:ligand-binding sensor domain-containing diguanylate cyclase [Xanthomonas sp. XNM01]|uniref:ligand-binding sensor domain-containing diguanylate cyclase n=1 Tax=Xanthomonas sp. XNM01 TaxID=2769289 RepID=UPI001780966F|nr:ligand-binding sensor domain-containing diguanylate cyclase [Xanthomonas sp. XNM01]MBD9367592.1 diguanylate cyclase [Xanthomonas sp. XNM01]